MNGSAKRSDYLAAPPDQQEKIADLLRFCLAHGLSIRFEAAGRDVVALIGPGFANPKYWMDRFQISAAP